MSHHRWRPYEAEAATGLRVNSGSNRSVRGQRVSNAELVVARIYFMLAGLLCSERRAGLALPLVLQARLGNATVTKSCKSCNSSRPRLQAFLNPDRANCCTSQQCALVLLWGPEYSLVMRSPNYTLIPMQHCQWYLRPNEKQKQQVFSSMELP
jgi:hypothetical protein